MLKSVISVCFLLVLAAYGQQAPGQSPAPGDSQLRVKVLNVCAPTADELAVLKNALGKVPAKPSFIQDFEIARGRTTLKDSTPSLFVRLRREHPSESAWLTAQYSISVDDNNIVELLVLRTRDPKEIYELILEDQISAGAASPATVLTTDTPPSRIRVERLQHGAVALARCPDGDQTQFEPLFAEAAAVMARYRLAMGLRTAFRSDIAWLAPRPAPRTAPSQRKQP